MARAIVLSLLTILQRSGKNQQGVALLEFVLMLPIALVIMLGLYEGYNLVALHNNLNEIATKVASWVGQQTTQTNINDCFIGAWLIGQNYDFALKGSIAITGVRGIGSQYKIVWQLNSGKFASSKLSANNSGVVVNPPFNLANNQNLIIVEVQYPYVPFFSYMASIFPTLHLYKTAQAVPQQSNFSPLPVS
jgi:Flp pilus assembly protein TadG